MVHALKEAWRALVPGGSLLDLRPFASRWPLEVVAAHQTVPIGRVDDRPGLADDLAANAAIAQVTRDGWFMAERTGSFPLANYWDSLPELLDYAESHWANSVIIPNRLRRRAGRVLRAMGGSARVRVRMRMIIGRYRKIHGPP